MDVFPPDAQRLCRGRPLLDGQEYQAFGRQANVVRPGRKARQVASGEAQYLLAFGQVLLKGEPDRRDLLILLPGYCLLLFIWGTDNTD